MHMPYNHSSHSIQNQLLRQLPPEQLDRLIPHLEEIKLPPKKVLADSRRARRIRLFSREFGRVVRGHS
jgi:hypothetical protein